MFVVAELPGTDDAATAAAVESSNIHFLPLGFWIQFLLLFDYV